MNTSEILKNIRKERGYTIQAISDATGIAVRTYQNYEYGQREISTDALCKLANLYNVTTDYLLGRETSTPTDNMPEEVHYMFSLKLKELRESHNLSQQAFANTINVSQSTVGMWESNKRTPDSDMLSKIADYFDVSIDYLIGRTDKSDLDKELAGINFALYKETKDLTDIEKQDILDYIRFKKQQNNK